MSSFSVVIPVKDGARYLAELLDALRREAPDQVLVIDSGSRDASVQIARDHGAEVLSIEAAEFGHGRTRNLGAERARGDFVCFLTQDATPVPGWLGAYREAFRLDERVGAAFGPHLPRPGTSPMIARELEEFFASFSPDGSPALQRAGDATFLSNVNACYRRACWEQVRFREVAYSEDQAFGMDMLAAGWAKVFHPGAAVLHSHDYPLAEFMRRYFDEYRGLRATTGHVQPFAPLGAARHVLAEVAGDRRWLAERGVPPLEAARWTVRSAAHHGGRQLFSALGSRAERLPAPVRAALSLESRPDGIAAAAPAVAGPPPTSSVAAALREADYAVPMEVWREGPRPLLAAPPGLAERESLRIAMVIPPFGRGSGGHNTLFQILSRLEQRGHVCSVYLHDYFRQRARYRGAVLRHEIREYFAPIEGPVYADFTDWHGADVAIATGWQTAHPVLRLEGVHARAYVVNDHEPEFYETSTERVLAADTYRHGMHCLAASPWLRDVLIDQYGASADAFQLGVDTAVYHPRPIGRRRDTVVYYARHSTPRRAVPFGLMALEELHRRRPDLRIVLFGTPSPAPTTFPYEHAGVLAADELARLYSHATVGLCLSLTNFSLMPKEMLACGLPCVELAGVSAESIFAGQPAIELAPLSPAAIADSIERLLDDEALWERRSRAGIEYVATHTWDHATDEVEDGLRHALRLREAESLEADSAPQARSRT